MRAMLSGRDVMRPLIGIATAQIDDLDGPRPHECPAQGTSQDRDEPHRANPEDPDSGQTTIVMIGFALVTLLLVVTVMAITSVYVGERQLQSLADRAAGAAADTFTNVDRSGSGPPTPILTNGAVAPRPRVTWGPWGLSTMSAGCPSRRPRDRRTGRPPRSHFRPWCIRRWSTCSSRRVSRSAPRGTREPSCSGDSPHPVCRLTSGFTGDVLCTVDASLAE